MMSRPASGYANRLRDEERLPPPGMEEVQGMEAAGSRPGDGEFSGENPVGGLEWQSRRRHLVHRTGVLLLVFSLVWIASFYSYGGWAPMLVLSGAAVSVLLLLWLLNKYPRLTIWCGHAVTALLLLGVTVSDYATGGVSGTNLVAFLLVPVVAQICVGTAGLWWLLPTLAVAGGMEWAALSGHEFPNLIPLAHRHFDEVMTWTGILLVLAFIIFGYERVRARWERELGRQRDQARQAAVVRSRFLASMSHEFRTPLNVIIGNCSLLAKDCRREQDRHRLELIDKNAYALLGMVEDALDMARMDAGGLEVHVAPFDPGQVVADTVHALQGRLEEKGQRVQVEDLRNQPHQVRGDAFRLRQILINLLDNIVKFADPGRTTIRLRDEPQGWLVVEVEDSGPGIPREDWQMVLEPFSRRARESGKPRVEPGLVACRRVAGSLGGSLELQQQPGSGSRFVLQLPFPTWQEQQDDVSGRRAGALLVVEDDDASRELVETILRGAGYSVLAVSTAGEALRLLKERQYPLALVDINLPDMNGLEIVRAWRAREQPGQHAILVALTANALPQQRDACLDTGMDEFVTKPIEADRLLQVVQRWMAPPTGSEPA